MQSGSDTDSAPEAPEAPCTKCGCECATKIKLPMGTQTNKVQTKCKRVQVHRQFYIDSETNTEPESSPRKSAVLPFNEFSDLQTIAFTGVSRSVYQFLLYRIGGRLTDSRNISRELKLALVLVRLKMNLQIIPLAAMFNVDRHAVTGIFKGRYLNDVYRDFV